MFLRTDESHACCSLICQAYAEATHQGTETPGKLFASPSDGPGGDVPSSPPFSMPDVSKRFVSVYFSPLRAHDWLCGFAMPARDVGIRFESDQLRRRKATRNDGRLIALRRRATCRVASGIVPFGRMCACRKYCKKSFFFPRWFFFPRNLMSLPFFSIRKTWA